MKQMIFCRTVVLVVSCAALAGPSLGASPAWPADRNPWPRRVAITVENPSDQSRPASLVEAPLDRIKARAPDFNPAACAVCPAKPAGQSRVSSGAGLATNPVRATLGHGPVLAHQVVTNVSPAVLVFVADLPPGKTRFDLYYDPQGARPVRFEQKSHAANGWESERVMFGTGANGFYAYGKSRPGLQLRRYNGSQRAGQAVSVNMLDPTAWGAMLTRPGDDLGCGGLAIVAEGQDQVQPLGRVTKGAVVLDGPVLSAVDLTYPLVAGAVTNELIAHASIAAGQSMARYDLLVPAGIKEVYAGLALPGTNSRPLTSAKWIATWGTADPKVGPAGLAILSPTGLQAGPVLLASQLARLPLSADRRITFYAGAAWSKAVERVGNTNEWASTLAGYLDRLERPLRVSLETVETNPVPAAAARELGETEAYLANSNPLETALPARAALGDYGLHLKAGEGVTAGEEAICDVCTVDGHTLLFVQGRVPGSTVKKLKLSPGQLGRTARDLTVKEADGIITVANSELRATFTAGGLTALERKTSGGWKRIACSDGTVGTVQPVILHAGPVAVIIRVGQGATRRDYYFYRASDLFEIEAPRDFGLQVEAAQEVYVTHFCAKCQANPTPTTACKLPVPVAYPADWAWVDTGGGVGLWLTATPGCTELQIARVNNAARVAPGIEKNLGSHGYPQCILEDTMRKSLPERVRITLGVAENALAGRDLLMRSTPPFLVLPDAAGRFAARGDLDNNGIVDTVTVAAGRAGEPDFLSSTWYFDMDSDSSIQSAFEFEAAEGKPLPERLKVYGDIDDGYQDGVLSERELKFPAAVYEDYSGRGRFVANSFFRGGIVQAGKVQFEIWNTLNNYETGYLASYWGQQVDLDGKADGSIVSLDIDGDGQWEVGYDAPAFDLGFDPKAAVPEKAVVPGVISEKGFFKLDYQKVNPPRGFTVDFTDGYTHAMHATHYGSGSHMVYWECILTVPDEKGSYYIGYNDWPQGTISFANSGNAQMRWYGAHGWVNGQWHSTVVRWCFDLFGHDENPSPYAHWDSPTLGWIWNFALFGVEGFDPAPPAEFSDPWGHSIRFKGAWVPPAWDGKKPLRVTTDRAKNKQWMESFYWAVEQKPVALLAYFDEFVQNHEGPANPEAYQFSSPPAGSRFEAITGPTDFSLYFHPVDGHWHFSGAKFGISMFGVGRPANAHCNRPEGATAFWVNDVEFVRPWSSGFDACFDGDGDGVMDTFLRDGRNDGFYERRIWCHPKSGKVTLAESETFYEGTLDVSMPSGQLLPEKFAALNAAYRSTTNRFGRGLLQTFAAPTNSAMPTNSAVTWKKRWTANEAGRVLLDLAHSRTQKPAWSDLGKNGFSRLFTAMSRYPLAIATLTAPIGKESLASARLLVLLDPAKEPSADERAALDTYLQEGGRVLAIYGQNKGMLDTRPEPLEGMDAGETSQNQGVLDAWLQRYGISGSGPDIQFGQAEDTFLKDPATYDGSKLFSGDAALLAAGRTRLYYAGKGLALSGSARALVAYKGTPLLAQADVGKGSITAAGAASLIGNVNTAYNDAGRNGDQLTHAGNSAFLDALVLRLLK